MPNLAHPVESQMLKSIFVLSLIVALCLSSHAAEITSKNYFLGPFGRSTHIGVEGEIVAGDLEKISSIIGGTKYSQDLKFSVSFNSPGGSLFEAISIGRYLSELPVTVTTDVEGVCASACIFAYLGGHYRFSTDNSRIGVHQFFLADPVGKSTSESVSLTQIAASELVQFLQTARVKSELFAIMAATPPETIYWLSKKQLADLNVVTGPVYEQSSEYKNANGNFYLLLWQQSYFGENKVTISCVNEKLVMYSFIQPHDVQIFDHSDFVFEVTIDGIPYSSAIMLAPPSKDARWAKTFFSLPSHLQVKLETAESFGVRHVSPLGLFVGFEFKVQDSKLSEFVSTC